MSPGKKQVYASTIAGIIAILLWSGNIAFSKSAMEQSGNFNSACCIYFFSSIVSFLLLLLTQKKGSFLRKLKNLPLSYYLTTGVFFILNNVLLFVAIAIAKKSEELLIVTIINYSWPVMIYVIRVLMFRVKIPIALFITGILLSFAGIIMALIEGYSAGNLFHYLKSDQHNFTPYILAFLTSVSWAIYSNLTIRNKSEDDLAGIPVVFFLSSMIFLIILVITRASIQIDIKSIVFNKELLFLIVGPTSLAYLFWYIAMKKGNKTLVTSLSFFTPLLAMLVLHAKLHLHINSTFWIATLLLIGGSTICYQAFKNVKPFVKTEDSSIREG